MKRKKEIQHYQAVVKDQPKALQAVEFVKWKYYLALALILLLSILVYFSILNNGFVWDDEDYIINNNLIKDLSWKGIRAIFYNFGSDNYAPLTDLINAIQFKISGLDPSAFHFGSLVFHLTNISLVFWFTRLLSNNWNLAAIAALLFGIHPIQAESVAWASGASNLYCAAFFLGSLIAYLYYLQKSQKKYLLLAFLLFILSSLSKAVAVALPLVLLLIDYYKDRKITTKSLLEKSPFFVISLAIGILTLVLKNNVINLLDTTLLSIPQRIIFACYGFVNYLLKILLPVNLSAFYPYPVKDGAIDITFQHYASIFFLILLLVIVIYSLRFTKKVFFSLGFYTVTIFLVLQLLTVGGAVMADRYCYIPSIGIFFLASEGFLLLWNKKLKLISIILLCTFTIFFSVKTYTRCGIWHDETTFWTDVIDQNPTVQNAYYNRGNIFMNEKKNQRAIADFGKAIELNPKFTDAYYNRGLILRQLNRSEEAVSDFSKAIELNPGFEKAYFNRGSVFMIEKKYDEAIFDLGKTIELNPKNTDAYISLGTAYYYQNNYDEAIRNYTLAIEIQDDEAIAFYLRGWAQLLAGNKDAACEDVKQAEKLGYKPATDAIPQICN